MGASNTHTHIACMHIKSHCVLALRKQALVVDGCLTRLYAVKKPGQDAGKRRRKACGRLDCASAVCGMQTCTYVSLRLQVGVTFCIAARGTAVKQPGCKGARGTAVKQLGAQLTCAAARLFDKLV